jgi:hypothetical protein
MKFRITFLLVILGLAASSSVVAHAGCRNSTLTGTYAFTIHGQIFLPDGTTLLIDGLAKTTFDGKGNISQLDAVATNGNVAPGWRASTGTYSVNSDCTGTFIVTNDPQPPIHTQFIAAQSGNTIHAVVIDPGFAVTSDAERSRAPRK